MTQYWVIRSDPLSLFFKLCNLEFGCILCYNPGGATKYGIKNILPQGAVYHIGKVFVYILKVYF